MTSNYSASEDKHVYRNELSLKWIVLIAYIIQNSILMISLRFSSIYTDPNKLVISSTEVLLSEIIKLIIATVMCFIFDAKMDMKVLYQLLNHILFEDPQDFIKLSLPAILYIIQNNLQYIIETRIIFLVMYQFKILSTAFFFSTLLSHRIHNWEWIAIIALVLGVCILEACKSDIKGHYHASYIFGIVSVCTAIVTSGFAGVYYEKIMKSSQSSVWLINIQLSILSCLFELLACLTQNTETIDKFGFFNGYTQYTLAVCVLQASVGIMVALVVKYADNIHKGFASSISVIISELIELHIFHDVSINHSFLTGSFLIIMSTVAFGIYNNRHKSSTTNATTYMNTNITSMLPQYMSTPHYRVRSSSSTSTTSDYTLTSYSNEPSYIPLSKTYPLSQLSADSQVQGGTSYDLHQIYENDDSTTTTTTDIQIPIQNTLSHNDLLEYEYSTTSQSMSDHGGLLSDTNNRRMTSRSTDIYINTDKNKSKSTAIS